MWQCCVWKMVCDKENGVCDKVVCERSPVWKLCVKESSCVWKMVCDKTVSERWCGKRWCDKVVCQRWCGERWCVPNTALGFIGMSHTRMSQVSNVTKNLNITIEKWNIARFNIMPHLPRQTHVGVSKCHACHVKGRWMSPSATPAKWKEGGCCLVPRLPRKVPRRHRRPPATKAPATPNACRCLQVPRLPRETKVDGAKCHICHAKCRGVTGDQRRPSAPPSATCAAPATPNAGRCLQVPRLPRERTVDVA